MPRCSLSSLSGKDKDKYRKTKQFGWLAIKLEGVQSYKH